MVLSALLDLTEWTLQKQIRPDLLQDSILGAMRLAYLYVNCGDNMACKKSSKVYVNVNEQYSHQKV